MLVSGGLAGTAVQYPPTRHESAMNPEPTVGALSDCSSTGKRAPVVAWASLGGSMSATQCEAGAVS